MSKFSTFAITFMSYAALQGSRSMWSYMQKYTIEKQYFGIINLTFLVTYGVCMNRITSDLCHKGLKGCFLYGILSTGIIMLIFSILFITDCLSTPIVLVLMIANGFGQALCFPSCTNILGNWFKNDNIGLCLGIWIGCTNFGSIVALTVADIVVLRLELSPAFGFLCSSCFLFASGFIIFQFLIAEPKVENHQVELLEIHTEHTSQETFSPDLNVWKIPGIFSYITCYSCLKGTSLGFMFWFPYFLQSKSEEYKNRAAFIYSCFDIGSYCGAIIMGRLGDEYKNRVFLFVPCLAISMILMLIIGAIDSISVYYILILAIGFFHAGPMNNISGAITVELAEKLNGNKTAISAVSSKIKSFGAFTAASFQIIISFLDINSIFIFFFIATLIAESQCILILRQK